MCVFVHLQERERGEANGLTYAAQRQLPRKRRPQGKSGNKLVSFCTSAPKNSKLELKRFIFLGVLAAVGLRCVCQGVKSPQWCTATQCEDEGSELYSTHTRAGDVLLRAHDKTTLILDFQVRMQLEGHPSSGSICEVGGVTSV